MMGRIIKKIFIFSVSVSFLFLVGIDKAGAQTCTGSTSCCKEVPSDCLCIRGGSEIGTCSPPGGTSCGPVSDPGTCSCTLWCDATQGTTGGCLAGTCGASCPSGYIPYASSCSGGLPQPTAAVGVPWKFYIRQVIHYPDNTWTTQAGVTDRQIAIYEDDGASCNWRNINTSPNTYYSTLSYNNFRGRVWVAPLAGYNIGTTYDRDGVPANAHDFANIVYPNKAWPVCVDVDPPLQWLGNGFTSSTWRTDTIVFHYVPIAQPATVYGRIYLEEPSGNDVLTKGKTTSYGQAQCDNLPYLNKPVTVSGMAGTVMATDCNAPGPYFTRTNVTMGAHTISIPNNGENITWTCSANDASGNALSGVCSAANGNGNSINVNVASDARIHVFFYVKAPSCTISGPATVCSGINLSAAPVYTFTSTSQAGAGVNLTRLSRLTPASVWETLASVNSTVASSNTVTFPQAGSYSMICRADNTVTGAQATGNAGCVGPPWSCIGYTNAGNTSRMTVTAQSALAGPASVTVMQNPAFPGSGGPVRVNWMAVAGATGYKIYRLISGTYVFQGNAAAGSTYWNDPDVTLTCGTNYSYKVRPILGTNSAPCQEGNGQTGSGMCVVSTAWYSAAGGDVVAAGGGLGVTLPVGSNKFINAGANSIPGVAIGNGISGLTSTNVSTKGWLVNLTNPLSILVAKEENKFTYLREKLVVQMSPHTYNSGQSLGWNIDQAMAANKKIKDIAVLEYSGSLDLAATDISANTNKKAAIVIKGGNLTVNGNIKAGTGGFLLFLVSGNITVDGNVGESSPADITGASYAANLEGIYYAQGTFDTGASTKQLRVDGTVIGMGGVTLGRTFVGVYPAEHFYFRPDFADGMYDLGLRKKVIQE